MPVQWLDEQPPGSVQWLEPPKPKPVVPEKPLVDIATGAFKQRSGQLLTGLSRALPEVGEVLSRSASFGGLPAPEKIPYVDQTFQGMPYAGQGETEPYEPGMLDAVSKYGYELIGAPENQPVITKPGDILKHPINAGVEALSGSVPDLLAYLINPTLGMGVTALDSYGRIRERQDEAKIDDPVTAALAGAGVAGLERLGVERFLPTVVRPLTPGANRLVEGAKGAGAAALVEGALEPPQEAMEEFAAGGDVFSPEMIDQYLIAAGKGSLGAAPVGALRGFAPRPPLVTNVQEPIPEPVMPPGPEAPIVRQPMADAQQTAPVVEEAGPITEPVETSPVAPPVQEPVVPLNREFEDLKRFKEVLLKLVQPPVVDSQTQIKPVPIEEPIDVAVREEDTQAQEIPPEDFTPGTQDIEKIYPSSQVEARAVENDGLTEEVLAGGTQTKEDEGQALLNRGVIEGDLRRLVTAEDMRAKVKETKELLTALQWKADEDLRSDLKAQVVRRRPQGVSPVLEPPVSPQADQGSLDQDYPGVREKIKGWKNAPEIQIHNSPRDAHFDAPDDARGAFYQGKVHLFKQNIKDDEDAVRVLLHETVGHRGLRGALGDGLNPFLDRVAKERSNDVKRLSQELGVDERTAAEEFMAEMAESGKDHQFLDRAIVALNTAIRKVFPSLRLSRAELREVLMRARKWTERSKGASEQTASIDTPKLARAYHGTPHKFDKFDSNKIGTGEGAQAYGHGLYFAENPGVAKDYAKRLSTSLSDRKMKIVDHWIKKAKGDRQKAAQMLKEHVKYDDTGPWGISQLSRHTDFKKEVDETLRLIERPQGHLYKVDIPDEHINKMLDWNKPLGKQPESVRKILETNFGYSQVLTPEKAAKVREGIDDLQRQIDRTAGNPDHLYRKMDHLRRKLFPDATGAEMYRQLGTKTSEEASRKLASAGIPGIRYLDQGSRDAGKGTSNYVVFDPDTVTILERNGEPLTGQEKIDAIEELQAEHPESPKFSRKKYTKENPWPEDPPSRGKVPVLTNVVKEPDTAEKGVKPKPAGADVTKDVGRTMPEAASKVVEGSLEAFRQISRIGAKNISYLDKPAKYSPTLAALREEIEHSDLPGKGTGQLDFNERTQLAIGGFTKRYEESKDEKGKPDPNQLRSLLDDVRTYANEAGLDLGYVKGYFPRMYDGEKLSKPVVEAAFIKKVGEYGIDSSEADLLVRNLTDTDGIVTSVGTGRKTVSKIGPELERKLKNIPDNELAPFLIGSIDKNADEVITRYLRGVVRRAEYSRTFGANNEKLEEMRKKIIEESLQNGRSFKKDEDKRLYDLADILAGNYGKILNPKAKSINDWLVTGEYMITLPLSAFANVSEPLIALEHGGLKASLKAIPAGLSHIARQSARLAFKGVSKAQATKDIEEMALGLDKGLTQMMTEMLETGSLSEKVQTGFFKLNQMTAVTRASQAYGAVVGEILIKDNLKKLSKKNNAHMVGELKDLGLDVQKAKEWYADGAKRSHPYYERIKAAKLRFVNGMVLMPSGTTKPLYMSNPKARLFTMLKGYFTVAANTIGKRMLYKVVRGSAKDKLRVATGLALMMAATHFLRELRDEVIYGEDGNPYTKRLSTGEVLWRDFANTGIIGPIKNYVEATKHGFSQGESIASAVSPITGQALKLANAAQQKKKDRLKREAFRMIPIVSPFAPRVFPPNQR